MRERARLLLLLLLRVAATAAADGDPCFHVELSQPGVCRHITNCSSVYNKVKERDPQYCKPLFNPGSALPNVCCPTDTSNRKQELKPSQLSCENFIKSNEEYQHQPPPPGVGATAKRKCREYVQYVCSEVPSPLLLINDSSSISDRCSLHVELVSGGQEAADHEFPHMALLGYGDNERDAEFKCGGSLISLNFILSAAHCQTSFGKTVGWVKLGMHRRDDVNAQVVRVKEVIVHPKFARPKQYDDIMLLRLEKAVAIGEAVRPACLDTKPASELVGEQALVTGWGRLSFEDTESSEVLLKAPLTVRPLSDCAPTTPDPKAPNGLQDTQICAGGGSKKDSCSGDSGGPLQLPTVDDVYCMYRIVGVVSYGPPCGKGRPAIYTKVSAYLNWIEPIVWSG